MRSLMPISALMSRLSDGEYDEQLAACYGVTEDDLTPYRSRAEIALSRFRDQYGDRPCKLFSVPGRTELGGNHTDHQHGRVLAAGISQDILAVAAPDDGKEFRVQSEGFVEDAVFTDDITVHPEEVGTPAALLRGTVAGFAKRRKPVGGIVAYTVSDVQPGSGLSSSAAFEIMLGTICNDFYADSSISPADLAQIAQNAENVFYGKPCGLMDQTACVLGGVSLMDFADPAAPVCEQIPFSLSEEGYALCIIDTGASHKRLTAEYKAVNAEMLAVAAYLGQSVLRETDEAAFFAEIPAIRKACGDRAVLRAMHFYQENARVLRMVRALKERRFTDYLRLVTESGRSSAFLLQNLYPAGNTAQQDAAVALALCEKYLDGEGACRIHGGGFGGTVQAYVPLEQTEQFRQQINAVFGEKSCRILQIRRAGSAGFLFPPAVTV